MTEARTIPPIREGLAEAVDAAGRSWLAGCWANGHHTMGWADVPSSIFADAVISYLRSRHLLNDIALSNIKDEEAK